MKKAYDPRRAVIAGLAGSAAYLAEQYLDLKLLRFPGDDLKMLGMAATRDDPAWRVVGVAAHFINGTVLALFYAAIVRNRLPGHPAMRGFMLGQIENAALWPLIPLIVDRYHPATRAGLLPHLHTKAYAAQAILRHIAYGAVLGWVYQ